AQTPPRRTRPTDANAGTAERGTRPTPSARRTCARVRAATARRQVPRRACAAGLRRARRGGEGEKGRRGEGERAKAAARQSHPFDIFLFSSSPFSPSPFLPFSPFPLLLPPR